MSVRAVWQLIRKKVDQKTFIKGSIFLIGLVLLFGWVHTNYLIHPVAGTSMEDALQNGDRVFLNRKSSITRYSVVGFSLSKEEGMFVKRVIGMPGDSIVVQGNRLTLSVGDRSFNTTYSFELTSDVSQEIKDLKKIPPRSYFVIGDNVSVSRDSRSFGLVKRQKIEGKVQYKIYPLSEIRPIN